MPGDANMLDLIEALARLDGVRGAMLATPEGPVGAAEHTKLQPSAAADVAKTVRRMVVASTTANAPLRELLINFGASRMMIRPVHEDAVLIALLDRETSTTPIRQHLDAALTQHLQAETSEPLPAFGLHEGEEIRELFEGRLGPILSELERVYQRYRQRVSQDPAVARELMYDQIREWLLCCNPSNYTLPLLLDGLAETMLDDPEGRNNFVGEAQGVLRKAGALR